MSKQRGADKTSSRPAAGPSAAPPPLRILTLNIQVGMPTEHLGHYVTGAWRHVLPSRSARRNLDQIAELAAGYDIVALQEADAGSLRTALVNQVEYLAHRAGFDYWRAAVNRDLGPFAQHALGLISKRPLFEVEHHSLPGRFRGRGVLEAQIQSPGHVPLHLMVAHLALGRVSRHRQLEYIASLTEADRDTAVMGDLNCDPQELALHPDLQRVGLRVAHEAPTYPSWKPARCIDHVLISSATDLRSSRVLDNRLSDHLPVVAEIALRTQ